MKTHPMHDGLLGEKGNSSCYYEHLLVTMGPAVWTIITATMKGSEWSHSWRANQAKSPSYCPTLLDGILRQLNDAVNKGFQALKWLLRNTTKKMGQNKSQKSYLSISINTSFCRSYRTSSLHKTPLLVYVQQRNPSW